MGRIPCNGAVNRVAGASLVTADWRVRMCRLSGLVDILSGHLYVRTIPLPGCMDRRSRYKLLIVYCFISVMHQSYGFILNPHSCKIEAVEISVFGM